MQYHYSTQPVQDAARHIARSIQAQLQQERSVLWLASGGSGIAVAVEVAKLLANQDVSRLTVSLTDERYGEVGHSDENWQLLLNAGFSLPGAATYRPLRGKSRAETAAQMNTWLRQTLATNDYTIGLFGIGPDGHTAGLKPPVQVNDEQALAVDLIAEDFERITMTFAAIAALDEVVVQAIGDNKIPALTATFSDTSSLEDTPAAVLATLPESTLYTSIKQEDIV